MAEVANEIPGLKCANSRQYLSLDGADLNMVAPQRPYEQELPRGVEN